MRLTKRKIGLLKKEGWGGTGTTTHSAPRLHISPQNHTDTLANPDQGHTRPTAFDQRSDDYRYAGIVGYLFLTFCLCRA